MGLEGEGGNISDLKIIFVAGIILSCVSCSELQFIDQALTLKDYADEKTAQGVEVKHRDELFQQLLAAVKAGEILKTLKTSAELTHRYGAPVIKTPVEGSPGVERWLYRRQVDYFHSPKVYVVVNAQGCLTEITLE